MSKRKNNGFCPPSIKMGDAVDKKRLTPVSDRFTVNANVLGVPTALVHKGTSAMLPIDRWEQKSPSGAKARTFRLRTFYGYFVVVEKLVGWLIFIEQEDYPKEEAA